MANAIYYPPADRSSRWYNDSYPGAEIEPNCFVWHTTETGGVPSYGGGASAPHMTYDPADRSWYQHFRLDRSARALRNASGGVETNTLNAFQVEIIAYSDEDLARERGDLPVSKLSEDNLRDLGDLARFMHDEWGVNLEIDSGWLYEDFDAAPMTFNEWLNFYGHAGHNRVPENTHWDPGRLDIDSIIDYAKGGPAVGAGWNEDLTPGTPGNDITNLADTILPTEFGRDAADLLGYAASTLPWMRNEKFSKPGPYSDEKKRSLTWFIRQAYRHARQGRDAAREARDQAVKNGEKLDALMDMQSGADTEAIKAHIDTRHAERMAAENETQAQIAALSDRVEDQGETLDAAVDLLEQHAGGNLDADTVVARMGELLRRATISSDAGVDDTDEP